MCSGDYCLCWTAAAIGFEVDASGISVVVWGDSVR